MMFHTYHRGICRSSNLFISKLDYCRIYGIHRKGFSQQTQYCDDNLNVKSSSYTRKTKATSSFIYQYGIVREIDRRIQTDGLTLIPDRLSSLDLDIARSQHQVLTKALRSLSIDIHTLPSNEFPDSVFIEDTTVIIDGIAVITKPGASSRAGETTEVKRYLLESFSDRLLRVMDLPYGTLDGGDVLFTGNVILVGLSSRTNEQSINCLREIFSDYPVLLVDLKALINIAAVEHKRSSYDDSNNSIHHQMEEVLHLKSFCSACGNGKIVVGGLIGKVFKHWLLSNKINHIVGNLFKEDDIIYLPDTAAANCIYANETIIRRSYEEYPDSVNVFLTNPYLKLISQLEVKSDELAKVDGALTCCSVLF